MFAMVGKRMPTAYAGSMLARYWFLVPFGYALVIGTIATGGVYARFRSGWQALVIGLVGFLVSLAALLLFGGAPDF